jgi:uncharacterized protein YjiS (DUF1127 family)
MANPGMSHVASLNDSLPATGRLGLLDRLRQSVARYREYRSTYEELNALTDRELADLGLSRLNIRDVARESVYGE